MEDMLRMYVMQQPTKWEKYLHLIEFSYNNKYHESLRMSPFEVLYERKCRVPINWYNLEDKLVLRPDMLAEIKKAAMKVRKNLKAAQDWKKMYTDKKWLKIIPSMRPCLHHIQTKKKYFSMG